MKKVLLSGFALLAFAAAPAMAADLPARAPVYKAAPAMAASGYSWTGFYLGIEGGAIQGRTFWSNGVAAADTGEFSKWGALFGGTIGANYQMGSIVLGVEADGSWANPNPSTTLAGCGGIPCTSRLNTLVTARGRVGVTITPPLLAYVTGGGAWGRINHTFPVVGTPSDIRSNGSGWTAGGGLEYGLTGNWSVKGEYLFYSLGSTLACGAPTCTPDVNATYYRGSIIRAGLNYRFGGGPVVARY